MYGSMLSKNLVLQDDSCVEQIITQLITLIHKNLPMVPTLNHINSLPRATILSLSSCNLVLTVLCKDSGFNWLLFTSHVLGNNFG